VSRTILVSSLFLGLTGVAFAQSFEVASIKPAAPMTDGRVMIRMGGDPGRINYTNVSLKQVLTRAYRVRPHQIQGPSWLDSERWDIIAKIPEGVSQDQVPEMLQNLLKERFGMVVHKESKEQPVYALTVGKNGHKLQKAKEEPAGASGEPVRFSAGGGPAGSGGGSWSAAGSGTARVAGAGGGGGMMMRSIGPGGGGSIQANKVTLSRFADMLSSFMDKPVINETGIEGEYDIKLDMAGDDLEAQHGAAAPGAAAPGGGAPAAPAPTPAMHGPVMVRMGGPGTAPPPGIFNALTNLGLKLDQKKAPIDLIVVDKIEKAPTEN